MAAATLRREIMKNTVRTLLLLSVVLAIGAGVAIAGCGHKDTQEGTLKSVDAEKKAVVLVVEDGKEIELKLTAKSKVMDAEGKKSEASNLVGKKVKVVSEHAEIDSIEQIA
jgi:hypothetical protein